MLDFTQTQRPGRINRINSLLETEADSSLKSAEYKLLESFSFDINISTSKFCEEMEITNSKLGGALDTN